MFVGGMLLMIVLVIVWLSRQVPTKGLARDALEVMRRDMRTGTREARLRGRTLILTGNEQYPPIHLGRIRGCHRDPEAQWYEYHRGIFSRARIIMCNPDDVVSSHDGRQIHIRAVSVRHHRGIYFAVPDSQDPREYLVWSRTMGYPITTPGMLAEAWKDYCTLAVQSILSVDESLLAAQDRHYLRQRVTYTQREQMDETRVPQSPPPTVAQQKNGGDADD
jgi:hypothetical protein